MKLGTIPDPFSGEKIAAIYPRIAPFVEQSPRLGRLHYFPGRHLTATALQREQTIRTDRLGLRGRAVTHGVVDGLELTARSVGTDIEFQLRPGHALTSSGLDIVVDRTVAAPVASVPFIDPLTRELSYTRPGAAMTAVLLLQPGYIEDDDKPLAVQQENGTDFTPGPRVPEDEVYNKTTLTDASRLVLYPLPWEEPAGDDLWQNRAAWSVFNEETEGRALPWHEVGVPVALIGFDATFAPVWIDRHAVVRPAGKPRQRVLIQPSFDARTWPARFDQFCAQLSSLADPIAASALFQFLPPIGLLPKTYLALANKAADGTALTQWQLTQSFFPSGYTVDVGVVPLEQLDSLLADTVRLQPYNLSHLDTVRILLPVSQQRFDPDLLKIEQIDPAFARAVARFRDARAGWLASRYDVAGRRRVLELSVDGKFTPYPFTHTDPDPKRLESPEERGTQPPVVSPPPGFADQYDVTRSGSLATPVYDSNILTRLRAEADAFIKEFTPEDIDEFGDNFKACGLTAPDKERVSKLIGKPEWLDDVTEKGTDTTLRDAEKIEMRRELIAYIQKQLKVQDEENKVANQASIQDLIAHFEDKADEADELVESGFLKVRTDVFRLGQLLNNNSLGTKFAASPTLANIVERKPARADGIAVNAFASQLLANFAPSAATKAAATEGVTQLVSKSSAASLPQNSIAKIAGSSVGNNTVSFSSEQLLQNLSGQKEFLSTQKNTLNTVAEKFSSGSAADIAALDALKTAQSTIDLLSSQSFQNTLLESTTAVKFAGNYVENFNLLSQKQIRAIPLDRLQPALAPTVRKEISDGRLEIFERLTRLNLSLGDLTTDFVDTPDSPARPPSVPANRLVRLRLHSLIIRRFDSISRITESTTVVDSDESKHFSSGVSYADMAQAALRAVEKRIKEYRAFVASCRASLNQTQATIARLTTELASVEVELDESRQDVAVSLAIMAEEQARLDGINAHRAKVLADHLEFLVFCRPRAVKLNTSVPSRRLEPALTREPVVECLREDPEPPSDLAALRDIFRASPARWFKFAPKWIEKVDRWEHLRDLLDRSARTTFTQYEFAPAISQGRYAQTLGKVFKSRQSTAQKHLLTAQAIIPAALVALSWRDLQQQAEKKLTLGHLISAGPAPLAKAASEELKDLFSVATCLHENFSGVPGLVRLDWAERFGQFDNVNPDFRDLSRLPSWNRIDFTLRREMQLHADWLFSRIDQTQPDALDLINDLIRVALLLASHAPVDQLVVGQPLENNITPTPGGILKLKVDPLRIRRGMDVTYKISDTQILRAVVEDISSSHVAARIIDAPLINGAPIQLNTASNFYFKSPAH